MQTVIKSTFIENLFYTLFNLEPDRPMYYLNVVRTAQNIFINLGLEEKSKELNQIIQKKIEKPYNTTFLSFIYAFYEPKFMFSRKAFCKVGDRVCYRTVTRYEIMLQLEEIKEWIYNECSALARNVKFTGLQQINM